MTQAHKEMMAPPTSEVGFGPNPVEVSAEIQVPEEPQPVGSKAPSKKWLSRCQWDALSQPIILPEWRRVIAKWIAEAYHDFIRQSPRGHWAINNPDPTLQCFPPVHNEDILVWAMFDAGPVDNIHAVSRAREVVVEFSWAASKIRHDLIILQAEIQGIGYQLSGINEPYDVFEAVGFPIILPITHQTGMAEYLGRPHGYLRTMQIQPKKIQLWLNLMPVMIKLVVFEASPIPTLQGFYMQVRKTIMVRSRPQAAKPHLPMSSPMHQPIRE
ncbi:hypothetical protein RSAG8_03486, partial [Rhizoctonia solani AG-8 WAC10335]